MDSRRGTITAALIVLVCFFLPWIQVSCGGTRDTASGVDLARDSDHLLWLIPLLMLSVLVLGSVQIWQERRQLASLVSLISGLITAYLMNRERLKFADRSGLIQVGVTGWFWLGLGSSIAMTILAAYQVLRMRKANDREQSL